MKQVRSFGNGTMLFGQIKTKLVIEVLSKVVDALN